MSIIKANQNEIQFEHMMKKKRIEKKIVSIQENFQIFCQTPNHLNIKVSDIFTYLCK